MPEELGVAGASGAAESEAAAVVVDAWPTKALRGKLKPGPGRSAGEVAEHQRARIQDAMLEVVGERGYEAVTAREVARRAGVSTRAYYEHFDSKEACFLRTYEVAAGRLARAMASAQEAAANWHERLHLTFTALADELLRDPNAGRLVLCGPRSAAVARLERRRRAMQAVEAQIAAGLTGGPGVPALPQLVLEGVVMGVVHVAGTVLSHGRMADLPRLGDALAEWALHYYRAPTELLDVLDLQAVPRSSLAELLPVPSSGTSREEDEARSLTSDRALLLSAVEKLAAGEGCDGLTAARIRSTAGVSRRSFEAQFEGVEDCVLEAVERGLSEALDRAAETGPASESWASGLHCTIVNLCLQIASRPGLAGLCAARCLALETVTRGGLHDRLARLMCEATPPTQPLDATASEAMSGAIWGIIHHKALSGKAHRLPQVAATLSYLALAPLLGESAIAEIGEELKWEGTKIENVAPKNLIVPGRAAMLC